MGKLSLNDRSSNLYHAPMTDRYQDTRQHLLDTGRTILTSHGFSAMGLSFLLQEAGVPKGSFYHYFKSKEQFGEALLSHYIDTYLVEMEALLAGQDMPGRERLLRYFAHWQGNCCDCLVVKLSAEVADLSDTMRLILKTGTDRVVRRLAQAIEEAIADGSLGHRATQPLATNLYQLWLGAALLGKLDREGQQLVHAYTLTCQLLAP